MPTPDLWLLLGLIVGWLVLVVAIEYRLSGRAPRLPEPIPAPDLIDRLRLAVALSRHHPPQPLTTLYSRNPFAGACLCANSPQTCAACRIRP